MRTKGNLSILWLRGTAMSLVLALFLAVPSAMAASEIKVYVDDQQVSFSIHPQVQNGSTIVQLRPLIEALGIKVDWQPKTGTVQGQKGENQFSLIIDSRKAKVNGKEVALDSPGRVRNGHTLVPLRFIGEATSAVVGWNPGQRVIQVFSPEYIAEQGWDQAEAQRRANQAHSSQQGQEPIPSGQGVSGLYARHSLDLQGTAGCGGVCWDTFYFVDDRYVVTELPETGVDQIKGSEGGALTYQIKGDQLVLGNGTTHTLKRGTNGSLVIDDEEYTRYGPSTGKKLDGKYEASGYTALPGGGGLAKTNTLMFRPDGSFVDSQWTGSTSDGSSDTGNDTGTSTTITGASEASGTYSISGYTITLQYKDGTKVQRMFFVAGNDEKLLRIGEGDYLWQDVIPPYQNQLVEAGMVHKEVYKERTPDFKEEQAGIQFRMPGYQWAKLSVKPAYASNFSDFGNSDIIELTVKYVVTNNTKESINVNAIKTSIRTTGIEAALQETTNLRKPVPDELKAGASLERLAIFLLPAELLEQVDSMEMSIANVENAKGQDLLQGEWVGFSIFD